MNDFCRRHLGAEVDTFTFPGGRDRKTIVIEVAGTRYALAKRSSAGRARLEANVLRVGQQTSHAPDLIAQEDVFVLQFFVDGTRLTEELEFADKSNRAILLNNAGRALLRLQSHASWATELKDAPKIGHRDGWAEDFARTPVRLAEQLEMGAPEWDLQSILPHLVLKETAFVKWDSRPGNALVKPDRSVVWIDWEHAGLASPEDDLVWLLADEWTPDLESVEQDLILELAKTSALSADELEIRFKIKAVLHSAIRLGLVFRRKGDGPWWNVRDALEHDRVGVSRGHVQRVCKRAYRLCKSVPVLDGLAAQFYEIHGYVESR